MSITAPVIKVLWSLAHDQCAFPGCSQALIQDSVDATTGEVRTTPIGEQAHIRSAKPDGPRHDPDYPVAKLHTYDNLVLLCPTHHTRVDANGGAEFTADDLVKMRTAHESMARQRDETDATIRMYMAQQYGQDDKVLFEQVDLNGPSVDSMFVDVPFACRPDVGIAELMHRIAQESPGDVAAVDKADGQIVTGAAQALLHPDWRGNALLIGGPGQGKSTLIQYVCQFYRARLLRKNEYAGEELALSQLTTVERVPIRLDLRNYATWASNRRPARNREQNTKHRGKKDGPNTPRWSTIEEYIASEISHHSGGQRFRVRDLALLVSTRPLILALDGLDEVANLQHREEVSNQIVNTQLRLAVDAVDLVVLVATRPGGTTSALWSSNEFPRLSMGRLTHGLSLQYLQRWASVAQLSQEARAKLQRTFMENHNVPHIQALASYPMQLAILLHLLQRRQLLPQRRTELFSEYLKTFLDREQSEEKEPLLAEERQVIEDIHGYIGWYIQAQAEEGKSNGSIARDDLQRLIHQHLQGSDEKQRLAESLFSAVTTRVLCLVERDPGSFQFEVQSLREYFAAVHLFDEVDRDSRDDCLVALLNRPYWSNVCRFLVGMYSKGEVRGMRSVLQDLAKDKNLRLHPMLRSAAALFLNDRAYEGQKDDPIQEVVDFILDGPGVVLAEDGLLDVAGSGLQLSERAGRLQAVRHLKQRIENETDSEIRAAAAASLRRHAVATDSLTTWWWDQFDHTWSWLETASHLGVLTGLEPVDEARLTQLVEQVGSYKTWATQVLAFGDFAGSSAGILSLVRDEVNNGAVDDLLAFDSSSPLGQIVLGAIVAMARPPITAQGSFETKPSGNGKVPVLAAIITATATLHTPSSTTVTDTDWYQRLTQITDVWGDGWILRQAVSAVPADISLDTVALSIKHQHEVLATVVRTEAEARHHRGDVEWWRQRLADDVGEFATQHAVFSILTCAHSSVVIALATQVSAAVDSLAPKRYRAVRHAISAFNTLPSGRPLILHDALRLNQATFSARTLWLLLPISSEATATRLTRLLVDAFEDLLAADIGDLRELPLLLGSRKTIKFETFHQHRTSLPVGGWASDVKIGALRASLAEKVLQEPHQWPGDLTQRAVEFIETRMLERLDPLAHVADTNAWFGK
jgi:hypothetical protein